MFQRPDPMTIQPDALGHRTRFSDGSVYDEKCVLCGGTDAAGDESLRKVCLKASPALDLIEVTLVETVTRVVQMRGRDIMGFGQAHSAAEAHFFDKTPPALPADAVVQRETRAAVSCSPVFRGG